MKAESTVTRRIQSQPITIHLGRRAQFRRFAKILSRPPHAQPNLDLRPDLYTHYYWNEFPERFHTLIDTRRWGPGERLVFEPYTKEDHAQTRAWIARHNIFAETGMGSASYDDSVISLQAAE